MVDLEKTLLPNVYLHTVIRLLESKNTFSPAFIQSIKDLILEGEKIQQQYLQRLRYEGKTPKTIACKKGCSHCCGLLVKVATPELYLIFEYLLQKYRRAHLERIIKDLKRNLADMERCQTREERIKVTCAFLKKDSCSIYPVRPMGCRAWNSIDVNTCMAYLTDDSLTIPVSEEHYAPFDLIRKGVIKALVASGLKDTTEELNAGMLRLLEGEFGKT